MKTVIKGLLLLGLMLISWGAPAMGADPLFRYPAVPDSITDITARTDYFVANFWKHADMKRVFSSRPRLEEAFVEYLSPMSVATPDTVLASIDRLMKSVAKSPERQLFFGELAEKHLYGDSAEYISDLLYTSFLKPILRNKGIDKNRKLRWQQQFVQLNNTMVGWPLGVVPVTDRRGQGTVFVPDTAKVTVVMVADPECIDCRIAGGRLKGNVRVADLVKTGELAMAVLVATDMEGKEWEEYAARYPEDWFVGKNPDLDTVIDMRPATPFFILIDPKGRILSKTLDIERLLALLNK